MIYAENQFGFDFHTQLNMLNDALEENPSYIHSYGIL